ncbi:MAG: hypothetical protein WCJ35_03225 [Planctomycetota bacterium]
MATLPSVSCPCCAGAGEVTAERIAQLVEQGYPVQEAVPTNPCEFCVGQRAVPAVIAELVSFIDFELMPDRPTFASKEEFLEVVEALAQVPDLPCRDQAWATAACLLAQSTFDRGELPQQLWAQSLPFLLAPSFGRLLAAEVGMGIFTPEDAMEAALSYDHPHAADTESCDPSAPWYFTRGAEFWFHPECGDKLSALLAKMTAAIRNDTVRANVLADSFRLLTSAYPDPLESQHDVWRDLLAALPTHDMPDGSRSLRAQVAEVVFTEVLPNLPEATATRWCESIMRIGAEGASSGHELSLYAVMAIAYVIDSSPNYTLAALDRILAQHLELLGQLNLSNDELQREYGGLYGGIHGMLSHANAYTLDTFSAILAFLTNLQEECPITIFSNLATALVDGHGADWAKDGFRMLLHFIDSRDNPKDRGRAIGSIAEGMNGFRPPWRREALDSLLHKCEDIPAGEARNEALAGICGDLAEARQDPWFFEFVDRVFTLGLIPGSLPTAFTGSDDWIVALGHPLKDPSACYDDNFLAISARLIKTAHQLPAKDRGQVAPLLTKALLNSSSASTVSRGLVDVWSLVETLPPDDSLRTDALAQITHLANCNVPLVMEVLQRLREAPLGPNKLLALENACGCIHLLEHSDTDRAALDAPQAVLAAMQMMAQLGSMIPYVTELNIMLVAHTQFFRSKQETRMERLLARLACLLDQYTASLPPMKGDELDALGQSLFALPHVELVHENSHGSVLFRGDLSDTCFLAIVRRFTAVEDTEWRNGSLDWILAMLRQRGEPRARREVAHAILNALGRVELSEWHKEAQQKLATYAMNEDGLDLSVLKRGMVSQFVLLGEFESAEKLARQTANVQLRSEALADIARALAQDIPAQALAIFQEVVSPETRGKLSVELAPSMSGNAQWLWMLLESAAEDPDRLQEIVCSLLPRCEGPEVHELLAKLGWDTAVQGSTLEISSDPLLAVLEDLVVAECITAKKRDRILEKLGETGKSQVAGRVCQTVLDFLVESGQIEPEDAAALRSAHAE